jgi:pyruvate/2-oxoglutarate dehydrogenase complex dihydrolipoamide dehydrogenase (E3) component
MACRSISVKPCSACAGCGRRGAIGIVLEFMRKDGVTLLCCGKDLKLAKTDGGKIRLIVQSHGKGYDEVVDQLLVAVGRAPNVENLVQIRPVKLQIEG